jgi:hypothetical protein
MIAALYVETGGVYFGLPDVDPWDEARDARLYDGPWPVVAHPPCARWSILESCRGYRDGADEGMFAHALDSLRRFGGVLEHPRHSLAWSRFELPRPACFGWSRGLRDDEWATEIDQGAYGHVAHKPTWLLYVGASPPAMRWRDEGMREPVGKMHQSVRRATPLAFRDVLLDMARSAMNTPSVPG